MSATTFPQDRGFPAAFAAALATLLSDVAGSQCGPGAVPRLAGPVQTTIRDGAWLKEGSSAFHDTISSPPLIREAWPDD